MKTPCQAMQSVEANLDDLDDLHVAPQIADKLVFQGKWALVPVFNTVTMQKKYKLSEVAVTWDPANSWLSDHGFWLEGQCGFSGFQVTLRKPKDDVWACTARSDGRCQRHEIVMGFRSHDLPFLGFWHKLIGK